MKKRFCVDCGEELTPERQDKRRCKWCQVAKHVA